MAGTHVCFSVCVRVWAWSGQIAWTSSNISASQSYIDCCNLTCLLEDHNQPRSSQTWIPGHIRKHDFMQTRKCHTMSTTNTIKTHHLYIYIYIKNRSLAAWKPNENGCFLVGSPCFIPFWAFWVTLQLYTPTTGLELSRHSQQHRLQRTENCPFTDLPIKYY